ncbi:hypothetical protein lerEdw1_009221 [Lerista edwardsae]|nr:hypothetical protein lerEdw1_009221 [Lerista edwardsae]
MTEKLNLRPPQNVEEVPEIWILFSLLSSLSDQIRTSLDNLRRKKEELLATKDNARKQSQDLLNIASKLQRCEQKEKLETPAPFPPAIKWRIWDFWDANSILENATKTLKDNLKCRTPQHKETVTLDPKTAHPQLLISEDGTSLTLGDQQQSPPDGVWRCVLGSQDFWTGRHYWDIDVGQGEGWAIGVSIRRVHYDQDKPFGPETGLWALGKWEGQYRAVSPPLNPPLALSEEPKKIRVSLNCLGRQVTFFDAETAALLHACPISVGCVYIYYPFLCLWEKSCLTLDP